MLMLGLARSCSVVGFEGRCPSRQAGSKSSKVAARAAKLARSLRSSLLEQPGWLEIYRQAGSKYNPILDFEDQSLLLKLLI